MPSSHPGSRYSCLGEPTKATGLLLKECVPEGWLNPADHVSWKEVTLAKDKITTNYTASTQMGRRPVPPPKHSLHTASNARDTHVGLLGAGGPR